MANCGVSQHGICLLESMLASWLLSPCLCPKLQIMGFSPSASHSYRSLPFGPFVLLVLLAKALDPLSLGPFSSFPSLLFCPFSLPTSPYSFIQSTGHVYFTFSSRHLWPFSPSYLQQTPSQPYLGPLVLALYSP